jgi:hypothetical protein
MFRYVNDGLSFRVLITNAFSTEKIHKQTNDDELGMNVKEVMTQLRNYPSIRLDDLRKIIIIFSQDSRYPERDSNQVPLDQHACCNGLQSVSMYYRTISQ